MDEKLSLLARWSKFFIDRYRVTILIIVAIVTAGIWGITTNQRQDFPPIPTNFIFVQATYPGASSADVEQEVVIPVEQAVDSLAGVKNVRSNAGNSFGFVMIEMEKISGTEKAAEELTTKITKIGLPNNVETEVRILESTPPSMSIGIIGNDGQTTNDLLAYVSDIKPRIESASNDIGRIDITPSNEFEINIALDAAKLQASGLNYELVKSVLQSQIISLPGGSVKDANGRKESIVINAPVSTIDDLKAVSLGRVKLADIAEISRQPVQNETIAIGGYLKDGQPHAQESVYLLVYKKEKGDIVRMVDAINAELNQMKTEQVLPVGVETVVLYDTSPFITDQINTLVSNGLLGLILILVVLLLFINLRTAIVISLIIPMAFLITFFVLPSIGYTLNILTLFSIILTLGILVDNAIVIAEGIVHEIEKGVKKYQATINAVMKLGPAVTAATLTTIIVFIPFAQTGGIVGEYLKYIPYTIIIMLLSSYFLAVTVTPLLGRWLIKEQTYEERRQSKIKGWQKALVLPVIIHHGQNMIDWLSRIYRDNMQRIYAKTWKKWAVIIATVALLGISLGVFAPMLKFEQFPTNDTDTIITSLNFPAGTPYEEVKDLHLRIMDEVVQLPHFQTAFAWEGVIMITFTSPKERKDNITIHEINDELNRRLDPIRESINPEITIKPEPSGYGPPEPESDVTVELLASNSDTLNQASADLEKYLNEQSEIKEYDLSTVKNLLPSVDIDLDQAKLAQRGVNALAAAGTVNAVFAPQKIGSLVVREDGVSDDLSLKFSRNSTDSVDDLRNLFVPTQAGAAVKLDEVANVIEIDRLSNISRLDGRRVATFNIQVQDGVLPATMEQKIRDYFTDEKIRDLGLAKDSVVYGGLYATFQEDYNNLMIIFILAVILVYLILVYQFNSYFQPALIIMAIPLALIGVFPGLKLVGSTLNMISGLGIVALVGIVVNDAIVFISTYNRHRKEMPDAELAEVLVRTGHTRFKPILSTSITTIGGILPLTILDPFWSGLGISIIGGLVFSTIGTLVAIPVFYSLWNSLGRRLQRILRRKNSVEI